jgi:hypothetical protein
VASSEAAADDGALLGFALVARARAAGIPPFKVFFSSCHLPKSQKVQSCTGSATALPVALAVKALIFYNELFEGREREKNLYDVLSNCGGRASG